MSLEARFREDWEAQAWTEPGDRVIVACSGGLDSLVLLHLLRFRCGELGLELGAAHYDHRMRASSGPDADWVAGVAAAWGVPLHTRRAGRIPTNEAEARALRYEFLHELVGSGLAHWVVTAHHADDQVETVLFRIVRGTGIAGLSGIPRTREPGVLRPLLPFSRAEIEDYAVRQHIRPRPDPTNRSRRFARNRIRHDLVPVLEDVHPGSRAAILRLARNAERTMLALDSLVNLLLEELTIEQRTREIVLDRVALLEQPAAVLGELVRACARRMGIRLDEAGTAAAVEFITQASSGGRVELPDGFQANRDFDRITFSEFESHPVPRSGPPGVPIESTTPGRGEIRLGGRRFELTWGSVPELGGSWHRAEFAPDRLAFPLEIRGWKAGDRMRTPGGTKKLGKLFIEQRVPRSDRGRIPVLADAQGRVLWVAGRQVDPGVAARPDGSGWLVGARDAGGV